MTFKEKLQQEHPEAISENYDGGCKDCPHDYGYCEKPPIEYCRATSCDECWNREMPSEVQQMEEVKVFEQNSIKHLEKFMLNKFMDICMDAIGKQMPEKPFLWGDGDADGKAVYDMYSCPNCEKSYEIEERYRYCPNCGQRLDWENKNAE